MNISILLFETIDSTNTQASKQARQGAAEGLCVIATRQTNGRGRHGRSWISEKDSGLYFSIVLRPEFEIKYLSLITLMTGIAVHDALKEFGIKPDIKWVNDLLVNEKKISGILAETVETPKGLAVVVGIGVNLTSRNFPDEIAETATSVEAAIGRRISADEIAEELTKYLAFFYKMLCEKTGPAEIIEHWQRRSTYFTGKNVRVTLAGETLEGTTDGLEDNGALRVRTTAGDLKIVQAGDVEKLRRQ